MKDDDGLGMEYIYHINKLIKYKHCLALVIPHKLMSRTVGDYYLARITTIKNMTKMRMH